MQPPDPGRVWYRTQEHALVQVTPQQLQQILAKLAATGEAAAPQLDKEGRSLARWLAPNRGCGLTAAQADAAGSGADIFGNRPPKSSADTVVCTNCSMPLAANRFAPHLERCLLGRGRQRRAAPS